MQYFNTNRRGFTLVELLMVIIILSLITIATIPIVRPALDTRRIREASRMLAAQIAEAQVRAAETGRPAGIWIERLRVGAGASATVELSAAMDIYQCEVPPPWSGASTNTMAKVSNSGGVYSFQIMDAGGVNADTMEYGLAAGLIRPYDLVRFDYRGPYYRIRPFPANEVDPSNGTLTTVNNSTTRGIVIEALTTADPLFPLVQSGRPVPFQILRQPIKLSTTPLQLPEGTIIDLFHSGMGGSMFAEVFNTTSTPQLKFTKDPGPFGFTFTPSGALDKLYYVGKTETITQPLYFLVGKREKVSTDNSGPSAYPPTLTPAYQTADARETQTENHNFRDLENIWVSINPQTGLVTTSEVAEFDDAIVNGTNDTERLQDAVSRARQFATSAQTMGGR